MTGNNKVFTRGRMAVLIVMAILLVDQAIKIWVKTNMTLHESIYITDWFQICFIENNGMAYGMELGSKVVLSLFRLILIGVIGRYTYLQVRKKARTGYIVCLAMVIAGALGNIFDCMFYGLMFSASSDFYTSYIVPFGTGYAPFLMGKVVDMFYFPLIVTTWPQWVPFVGGEQFVFFSPIFNFADASISVGFVLVMLFYRKELGQITLKGGVPEPSAGKGND